MSLEIEKRFILKTNSLDTLKKLTLTKVATIKSILIKFDDKSFTRFRTIDYTIVNGNNSCTRKKLCTMCTKIGSGLIREELETQISIETYITFQKLYPKELVNRLYVFDVNGIELEVKELYNPNTKEKLYIVEVEFGSKEEASRFLYDTSICEDVTDDSSYNLISIADKFGLINKPINKEIL